jgi:hypothetical protein
MVQSRCLSAYALVSELLAEAGNRGVQLIGDWRLGFRIAV